MAGDHHALHLVGPLVDLEDLGVPEEFGDGIVLHESVAPEYLDGVGSHFHGHVRGEALGHGRHLGVGGAGEALK